MSYRLTNFIAGGLLIFVFLVAFFSMKDDSATMDEIAHLPAGYSYLTQKDMRLNPEHPPLIKDLAAIPLLFINGSASSPQRKIKFPSEIDAWQKDINGQWLFGFHFMYGMGNPADKMIFWGRIPMILILVLLGFYIFKWAKELFGNKAALLALFLFSFSPAFLAHGRLVTTDVGAATGVFIATYYFLKALKNPTKKTVILAGISFGLAELCKFSVILLIPFFIFLGLIWWLIKFGKLFQTLKFLILVLFVGYLLIGVVYQYHVWNYPPARQARDAEVFLSAYPDFIQKPLLWAADKPILRPYAQYLTGLFMVFHRAAFGNTTYFVGEVSNLGWKNYFPTVYSIKEPLAFHILTLIALLYTAWLVKRPFWINPFQRTKGWIKNHFPEFAILSFIVLYWAVSLYSNLNIGVRHLLPAFPFTILLVSAVAINFLKQPFLKLKYAIGGALILWQATSVISIYPYFLAYFNESVGGPDRGYIYVADSNLDWGQDLKRLSQWVDEKGIDKIYVDYSGGYDKRYYSAEKYYLKEKFAPWWGTRSPEELPKGSYLAVSAFFLQRGRGKPVPDFHDPTGYYRWLDKYTPVAKIDYSTFVYYIE